MYDYILYDNLQCSDQEVLVGEECFEYKHSGSVLSLIWVPRWTLCLKEKEFQLATIFFSEAFLFSLMEMVTQLSSQYELSLQNDSQEDH